MGRSPAPAGYHVDGFVLTEHRRYVDDADYSVLAEQYGVAILRGIEVETDVGHVLVYGVSGEFLERFDLSDVSLPYADMFRAATETGGIAVGAHAGRPSAAPLSLSRRRPPSPTIAIEVPPLARG